MNAAVFHRCGLPLSIENIAEPAANDLVIKVCACCICRTFEEHKESGGRINVMLVAD